MNQELIDSFLNTLYLKSKNNYRSGFSSRVILKLIGFENKNLHDILSYLSEKNLIDTKNSVGDKVTLTADGIDYVLNYREGKLFKTIRFINSKYIPPANKLIFGYEFKYLDLSLYVSKPKEKI